MPIEEIGLDQGQMEQLEKEAMRRGVSLRRWQLS